jgi:hypothetical protein
MKKSTYTITRFDVDDRFYVEVSPNKDMFDFVLCMENYGIKFFMLGLYKKDCPKEIWEEIIESNVEYWISIFLDEVEYLEGYQMD